MNNHAEIPIELYNLVSDIGEQNNIAACHPDVVKNISNIMDKEHTYSKELSFGHKTK